MGDPRVGIYLRLSRDDERQGESASIENQRTFLKQYCASRGWDILQEYADDGYSGLTFDRPQFQRMLGDIELGVIDTVLTKDLSRLGRDQIFTAYYYQIYFPHRGVRYIAVSEGLDTASSGSSNALFPFLTAANDFYTADVSRKVRAALNARKRDGKFVGAQAPLGYMKDPGEQGHLIIDEQAAPIIREIFQRYLKTGSVIGVAKELTEGKIPTPSQYRGTDTKQSRFPGNWSGTMVRRILTNPTYAGHLTQNRRTKINYKLDARRNLSREEWITVSNTHQPIISQEDFDQVQRMLALHSYQPQRGEKGHLLTGLAYCADCGSPMTYVRESPSRTYMVCQGYRKGGRLKLCTSHCVREDRVIGTIRDELRQLALKLDRDELEKEWQQEEKGQAENRRAEQLQRKIQQQKEVLTRLYEDRAVGILEEETFRELFQQAKEKRAALEAQLDRLIKERKQEQEQTLAPEELKRLLSFEDLDRGVVTALIERVLIYQDKTIEITFRFQQPT